MLKHCIIILSFCSPFFIYSQHTRSHSTDSVNRSKTADLYKSSMVIVPYHHSLYHSQIDQDLVKQNPSKSITQIRSHILETLLLELKVLVKLNNETHRVLAISPSHEQTKYLSDKIFNYKREEYLSYEPTASSKDSSSFLKMKQRYLSKEKETRPTKEKSFVQDGQLQSKTQEMYHYMGAVILQKDSLKQLFEGKVDAYLFLNQLDLLYLIQTDNPSNKYVAQLHYSFFDQELVLVKYGLVRYEFTSEDLMLDSLDKNLLSIIAKDITNKLFLK